MIKSMKIGPRVTVKDFEVRANGYMPEGGNPVTPVIGKVLWKKDLTILAGHSHR